MNKEEVPRHIAVILDGNGRWAKQRSLPRHFGHMQGCKTVEKIVEAVARLHVSYFTIYGFSTENWNRPKEEVNALMRLFRYYMKRLLVVAQKNNVKVLAIGEKSRFSADIIEGVERLEKQTKDNTGLTFILAINYGSRDEIVRAVKKMNQDIQVGSLSLDEINEENFSQYLDTKEIPDPDLLIRTGGEIRLSNYLLWQCAYTEFYFCDIYWPDFNQEELIKAIKYYNKRERRFGNV
ncbi:isoprenyl transferase [Clostridia bacterium]|nr:isoprenyl transferase [Clostridia bacterium]